MNYVGFAIRKKRIENNWSQEGLCKGICAVSYLSKIEQGKVEASDEVVAQLFEKLGIKWITDEKVLADGKKFVEEWYDAVFSEDYNAGNIFRKQLDEGYWMLENSPYAIDILLLKELYSDEAGKLDETFEVCMDFRQLAIQRILGGNFLEAEKLYPCAFSYLRAGYAAYEIGDNYSALMNLQKAYEIAAEEGRVRVMMMAKLYISTCYSNVGDIDAMEYHGTIAKRLALVLGENSLAETIDYNYFATRMEKEEYKEAYDYFSKISSHGAFSLHKLAICCEKLGKVEEAFLALEKEKTAEADTEEMKALADKACELVEYRLLHADYLSCADYGKKLLDYFNLCREKMPIGYAKFHLPWVMEWFKANRQYKQAYELLNDFSKNMK